MEAAAKEAREDKSRRDRIADRAANEARKRQRRAEIYALNAIMRAWAALKMSQYAAAKAGVDSASPVPQAQGRRGSFDASASANGAADGHHIAVGLERSSDADGAVRHAGAATTAGDGDGDDGTGNGGTGEGDGDSGGRAGAQGVRATNALMLGV